MHVQMQRYRGDMAMRASVQLFRIRFLKSGEVSTESRPRETVVCLACISL